MNRNAKNLTPYRREVLTRLHEAGRPLTVTEAVGDHPNNLPSLSRLGWAQRKFVAYEGMKYEITDDGRRVLGVS